MHVIVLGNGLLGSHIKRLYPQITVLSHQECDILYPLQIDRVLHTYKPDVVINTTGIVPKHPKISDSLYTLKVNSQGPKLLASACDEFGCKLVQISTNCVYSGQKGNYSEIDIPNPNDLYGMSKYLGEVTEYPHLVIRTSFVGFPDVGKRGLLHWASQQSKILGYDGFYWNGLTATEFARVLIEQIIPRGLTHLIHVHGEILTKYQLLEQAKEVFKWNYTLLQESAEVSEPHQANFTLTSEMDELFIKTPFKEQLQEMKKLWEVL